MAVLVQPALSTDFGGTARIVDDDVMVVGVAGSPAPLVQGWDPGAHVRVDRDGRCSGEDGIALLGRDLPHTVATLLRSAHDKLGVTTCEWGSIAGDVTLFQVMRTPQTASVAVDLPPEFTSAVASQVARAARRAPGGLGEALVLPWSVAMSIHPVGVEPAGIDALDALATAEQVSAKLTADVWTKPKPVATSEAQRVLKALRSSEPADALAQIAALRHPDPEDARRVLSLLLAVREALVQRGAASDPEIAWHLDPENVRRILQSPEHPALRDRIGFDRWEPFDAGVILSQGITARGTSAAPGVAAGRLCFIADVRDTRHFRSRDVVVATHPLPNHAALLWDAAALVTTGGGPAAHLFESARALAIPAVCGIHLDEALGGSLESLDRTLSIAVDGTNGRVAVTSW
jgi:hypothetical protein